MVRYRYIMNGGFLGEYEHLGVQKVSVLFKWISWRTAMSTLSHLRWRRIDIFLLGDLSPFHDIIFRKVIVCVGYDFLLMSDCIQMESLL